MGILDKMKDLAGKFGGKKEASAEDLSQFDVPAATEAPPESPSEPLQPKASVPVPVPVSATAPPQAEQQAPPIQNPEQKFFETIDKFSLEDLRKRKADLEKMLKLADEELASGIISQAAYNEIKKNAGEKLREVSFELKAVERLLKRIGLKKGMKKRKTPRKRKRKS